MVFGADNHLTDETIALYVDAVKLNRVELVPEEVREHVSRCQRCKTEIIELESLVDDRHYRKIRVHPTFGQVGEKRKFLMVYRIAASFLVIVGLGSAAYLLGLWGHHGTPERSQAVRQTVEEGVAPETAKVQAPAEPVRPSRREDLIAANFTLSPNLESVVNSTSRSEEVRVTSPSIGSVVGERISFRWETRVKPPFTLKILNNKEGEEQSVHLRTSAYVLRHRFGEGLYYWKLEANGELLYVGKFLVKSK